MNGKFDPKGIPLETWRALLASASAFAAEKPWESMDDTRWVGLRDSKGGEARIASVLGGAGKVFAAVFYRRSRGLRWILETRSEWFDPESPTTAEGLDALKVAFVEESELRPEDRAIIEAVGFNPSGKGRVWPQLLSFEPGWAPSTPNPAEAEQILADLPRLTAFCKLVKKRPRLFENRSPDEIPFLPPTLPDRPLRLEDLDWNPVLAPPTNDYEPFHAPAESIERLRGLDRPPGAVFEFDSSLLPGVAVMVDGRPCLGRASLLVDSRGGRVLAADVQSGARPPGESAGHGLINTLMQARRRPDALLVKAGPLESVLHPLCQSLEIRLETAKSLPAVEAASKSLAAHLAKAM